MGSWPLISNFPSGGLLSPPSLPARSWGGVECYDKTKDTAEVPGPVEVAGMCFHSPPCPQNLDHFQGIVVVQWTWTCWGGIEATQEWAEGLAEKKIFQAVKLSLWSETAQVSGSESAVEGGSSCLTWAQQSSSPRRVPPRGALPHPGGWWKTVECRRKAVP